MAEGGEICARVGQQHKTAFSYIVTPRNLTYPLSFNPEFAHLVGDKGNSSFETEYTLWEPVWNSLF